METEESLIPNLAIIGINSCLDSWNGLEAFERSIYDRAQNLNAVNWLKLPSIKANQLNPQELFMLKVANNTLRDAGLNEKRKIAVIIANENSISSQIYEHWNFTCPSFTLSAEENSAFKALVVAQMLLAAREVDAVLVGAVDLAGAVAVVLKLQDTAKQNKNRIYAVIDAISLLQKNSTSENLDSGWCNAPLRHSEAVMQACQQAFNLAGIQPGDISYMQVFGSGVQQEDESQLKGLVQAYHTFEPEVSCAIGRINANINYTQAGAEIASLIKTALCLYHRYIPASPQWSSSTSLPLLGLEVCGSPFYIPSESRPWFLEKGATRRIAAINSMGLDGTYAHLILSEEPSHKERSSTYLEQMPFYLFPIAADYRSCLLEQLRTLQQTIEDCSSLSAAASQIYTAFQKRSQATYALAILGHNKDELKREIQCALKGVANAFDTGEDWQTPIGSYFTVNPLAKRGNIAFVYPGAYSSYMGLAGNLFHLFPQLYDDLVIRSVYSHAAKIEKLLCPRSLEPLSEKQLEVLEKQLIDELIAMLEAEIGFAAVTTKILWIDETLKQKEHATIFLNRRGIDDHTSIIRALAKLLTHRVSLDLSPLYSHAQESVAYNISYSQETSQFYESITMKQENQQHVPPPSTANHKLVYEPRLPNLRNLQYQKLIENTTHLTKTHAAFLEARQESLRQISEITQLQIALLQQVLDQESLVDIALKHLPIP